jgi:hypothetical protein
MIRSSLGMTSNWTHDFRTRHAGGHVPEKLRSPLEGTACIADSIGCSHLGILEPQPCPCSRVELYETRFGPRTRYCDYTSPYYALHLRHCCP